MKTRTGIFLINLILLFTFNIGKAQLIIQGQVRDSISFVGVPNHQVLIFSDTTNANNFQYSNIITTNNQGFFTDTIFIPSGLFKFYVLTLDCNQNPVTDSVFSVYPTAVSLTICTGGINMCLSDFVAYPDTADYQQIHFYNLSSNNATSYLWDFGDGQTSTSFNVTHHYNMGSYHVCLSILDSNTSCSDTYCDDIDVSPTINCTNNFTYTLISSKKYSFVGSINNAYPTIYKWNFGDMTYGNGRQVQHHYLQPGIYTVKLQSTSYQPQSMDTCISFSQQQIHVNGAPTAGLWGQVFADTGTVDRAMVYLYHYNNNHELQLQDSTFSIKVDSLNISYYVFAGLEYGKYATYIRLMANSTLRNNFAPAYSGNTIYWDKSMVQNLNQVSTNMQINLTHLYKSQGSASISGFVYQESKVDHGDPVAAVPVYLLDNNKSVVDFQYSADDGSYNFPNLTNQKYFLYADIINHVISPSSTIITTANEHKDSINIYIHTGSITSLPLTIKPTDFTVFPNPAQSQLYIKYSNLPSGIINISISNTLGQQIIQKTVYSTGKTSQKLSINISNQKPGIYFLSFAINNIIIMNRKVFITK